MMPMGKMVPPAAPQCEVSMTNETGMPRRVRLRKASCSSRSRAIRQWASQPLPFTGELASMVIAPMPPLAMCFATAASVVFKPML